jgi:hypothetical protein
MDTTKMLNKIVDEQMKAMKLIIDVSVRTAYLPTFNSILRSALHSAAREAVFQCEADHFMTLSEIAEGSKEFVDTGGNVTLKVIK